MDHPSQYLKGITMGSAIFARRTIVTDRQTDNATPLCNNRPRLPSAAMRPNNGDGEEMNIITMIKTDGYKPRTGRTGQCMNHAPAVLATPAVYCVHGRIIHQAKDRQTVQNVNEKYTPSPYRLPQQTRIDRRTAQLLIKAGAWFIHWPVRPVRGLYR